MDAQAVADVRAQLLALVRLFAAYYQRPDDFAKEQLIQSLAAFANGVCSVAQQLPDLTD